MRDGPVELTVAKIKCHECGERKHAEETTLTRGLVGGSYRRAARWADIRICRDCVQGHVDFCLRAQGEGRNAPIDTGRVKYLHAAEFFGIAIPEGTLITTNGRRA